MAKETKVTKRIKEIAQGVYNKIKLVKQPELEMPIRALSNVSYDEKDGIGYIEGTELLDHNDHKKQFSDHRPVWIRIKN